MSGALPQRVIRCAIVGYGPTFNFGRVHARWIKAVPEMELVAVCDGDSACARQAKRDFPEIDVYADLGDMLARDDVDMVAVVTPHNTHAPLVIECLRAGKHTVVDKPMCLTIAEATEMIETARHEDRTLAVFHNRRHDGNLRAIKEVIDQGLIGEIFHIEVATCFYSRPRDVWRSQKDTSGGVLFDWGAHAIDWVLSLVPQPMSHVTGFFHKLVWHDVSNEDQARAIIRFQDDVVADVTCSTIAYLPKPLWYILGTKGAIVDSGQGAIDGYTHELIGPSGGAFKLMDSAGEREVPYKESDWVTFYMDMADHLLRGAPVPVSDEDGRRVITVLETAEKSARSGRSEAVPYH